MNEERYQKIADVPSNALINGEDILLEKGVIYWDTQTRKTVVQLKFRNNHAKQLRSLHYICSVYDSEGRPIYDDISGQFSDVMCQTGDTFGYDRPLILDTDAGVRLRISLCKAVWEDHSVTTYQKEMSDADRMQALFDSMLSVNFNKENVISAMKKIGLFFLLFLPFFFMVYLLRQLMKEDFLLYTATFFTISASLLLGKGALLFALINGLFLAISGNPLISAFIFIAECAVPIWFETQYRRLRTNGIATNKTFMFTIFVNALLLISIPQIHFFQQLAAFSAGFSISFSKKEGGRFSPGLFHASSSCV